MKPDETIYLNHILNSINNIEKSTKNITKDKFKKNIDLQDAIIRRIEVIGEAVKNISQEIKNKYPQIEWKKIAGTRDILIHAYFNVDLDLTWDVVENKLPKLKKQIKIILKELAKK